MEGSPDRGFGSGATSREPGPDRPGISGPRLAVVARAHKSFSPRIERAVRVGDALSGLGWNCVTWPPVQGPSPNAPRKSRPVRRALRRFAERSILLDRFEPESLVWRARFEAAEFDAGYLVTPSFSPAVAAARILTRRGRPYVVDTGDPWVLEARLEGGRRVANRRRNETERELLGGAAGIVVTTPAQASEIESRFPGIPVLVRPAGFQIVDRAEPPEQHGGDPEVLEIAHFGRFDMSVRVDPMPLLESLAGSGKWRRVAFTQFGPDPAELPETSRTNLVIEAREAVSWPEAVGEARHLDAAIVIGNRPERWMQLPSKAIEYLGLPIPRIALCSGTGDSLFEYAGRLPGYLVLTVDDREAADRVHAHLERDWDLRDLEPPEEESWDRVAEEIAAFVDSCLLGARGGPEAIPSRTDPG